MEQTWVTSAAIWILHTLVLKYTRHISLRRLVQPASITFSVFYSAAPSRSLSSMGVRRCFLFVYQPTQLYCFWGQKCLLNSVCSLSYSPLHTSTPEGGTALFWDAQRHELNPHQFQPTLANTCMCKGSFVWSLTVFFGSLPLTGSSPSLKGHCSWHLACFTLNPATWVLLGSLSSIQTHPSQHQANTVTHFHKYKKSAHVRHALHPAYWESRSAW